MIADMTTSTTSLSRIFHLRGAAPSPLFLPTISEERACEMVAS